MAKGRYLLVVTVMSRTGASSLEFVVAAVPPASRAQSSMLGRSEAGQDEGRRRVSFTPPVCPGCPSSTCPQWKNGATFPAQEAADDHSPACDHRQQARSGRC